MNMTRFSGVGAPMLDTVLATAPMGSWRGTSASRLPWLRRFAMGATVSRRPTMSQQYSIPSILETSLARYRGAAVKSRITRTLTIFLRTLTGFFPFPAPLFNLFSVRYSLFQGVEECNAITDYYVTRTTLLSLFVLYILLRYRTNYTSLPLPHNITPLSYPSLQL